MTEEQLNKGKTLSRKIEEATEYLDEIRKEHFEIIPTEEYYCPGWLEVELKPILDKAKVDYQEAVANHLNALKSEFEAL